MMKKNQKEDVMNKVRWGIFLTGILLLGVTVFSLSGLWIAALIALTILCLVLVVAYITSFFPRLHSKEFNKLNRIQKVFYTVSYFIEFFGYLN